MEMQLFVIHLLINANSSVRLERKSHPHSLHKFLPDYPVGGILLRTIEDRSRFLE